jgi:dephospho-CoA kinase
MPAEPRPPDDSPRPFRPAKPLVIGLLGGVAAGKSAVARIFAAHGLWHIDADAITRATASEPAVLAQVAAAFGPEAVRAGALDREAIGRAVFADPAARKRLEAILHPPVLARIDAELAAARSQGVSALLDVPLLLETGLDTRCDVLVFVAAAANVRKERAAARGWPEGELARREAAQAPLASKQQRAHHTVSNDGPIAATEDQVKTLLEELATALH